MSNIQDQFQVEEALVCIANNPNATPETVADWLDISVPEAEDLVRRLIEEGRLQSITNV